MIMMIPPVLSPIHAMDIPSVRRTPVLVAVPADRVSTHDLPLAETLSVAERELFHRFNEFQAFWPKIGMVVVNRTTLLNLLL